MRSTSSTVLGLIFWLGVLSLPGTAAHADERPADIKVTDAWIQWLPADVPSAGYMTLINTGSQTRVLVGAHCADYEEASFHVTRQRGAMTTMTALPSIEIKPRSTLPFARGGYHMMLMRPRHALHPGDHIPVTLQFADGLALVVTFEVRALGAGGLESYL